MWEMHSSQQKGYEQSEPTSKGNCGVLEGLETVFNWL